MNVRIDEKTFAVVVGIEAYGGDTLVGPAADAVRFSRLLIAQGMSPERIRLFVDSPGTGDAEGFPDGVERKAPTLAAIGDFFEKDLLTEHGATLIVFWGGHGVNVEDKPTFMLSGSRPYKAITLDFTDLRHYLASKALTQFDRQLFFIDACAEASGFDHGKKSRTLTNEEKRPEVEQFILFAAGRGEKAANDKVKRTGLFSQRLLELLTQAAEWDLISVAKDLDVHLEGLRADDETEQAPWYRWFHGPKGDIVPTRSAFKGDTYDPTRLRRMAGIVPGFLGRSDCSLLKETLKGSKILAKDLSRIAIEERLEELLRVKLDPAAPNFTSEVRNLIQAGGLAILIEELVVRDEGSPFLQKVEEAVENLFRVSGLKPDLLWDLAKALEPAQRLLGEAYFWAKARYPGAYEPAMQWFEVIAFVGVRQPQGNDAFVPLGELLKSLWFLASPEERLALAQALECIGSQIPEGNAEAETEAERANHYLVMEVSGDDIDQGQYQFVATPWQGGKKARPLQHSDHAWTANELDLSAVLPNLGQWLHQFLPRVPGEQRDRMVVEFVVPCEFLRHDFPRLSLKKVNDPGEGAWLGRVVAWVLRPSTHRDHITRISNLERRWKSPTDVEKVVGIAGPEDAAEGEIDRHLEDDEDELHPARCAGLGFVPSKDAPIGEKVLLALSRVGIPAAVWFHPHENSEATFVDELPSRLTGHSLEELPRAMRKLRREARQGKSARAWEHAVLMYDHPVRMPGTTEAPFDFEEIS